MGDEIVIREREKGVTTNDLLNAIDDILSKHGEEIDGTQFGEAVDFLTERVEEKAIGAASLAKKYKSFSEQIGDEISRLSDLKKSYESREERLKSYIKYAMGRGDIKKISGPTVEVRYTVIEDGKVTIIDKDSPTLDEYRIRKETYTLDLAAIKRDILTGKPLSAKLEPSERLTIKG